MLDGRGGADVLIGKGGADTLIGGEGADTLTGGAGDDTYHVNSSDTVTGAADDGNDTVYFTGTAISHSVTYTEFTADASALPPGNVETVIGTENDDKIRARAGGVTVVGGGGADTLIGCGGKDILYSNVGGAGTLLAGKPYAAPGDGGDGQINTFVIVSDDDSIDEIRDFYGNDQLVLAGFSEGTGLDDIEIDIDLITGETPDRTNDETFNALRSIVWAKFSVNGENVAWIKAGEVSDFGTTDWNAGMKTKLLDSTSGALVFDRSYDTGCP